MKLLRFHSLEDKKLFLVDVGLPDLTSSISEDYYPADDLIELFLKKRKKALSTMFINPSSGKDFRRSQSAKKAWTRHGNNIRKGIKIFHTSMAGKKFHRSLSRFLLTREELSVPEDLDVLKETLLSLQSMSSHTLHELKFYHTLTEDMDYWEFTEMMVSTISLVTSKLLSGSFQISEFEADLLLRCVQPNVLCKTIEEVYQFSIPDIEEAIRDTQVMMGDNLNIVGGMTSLINSVINNLKEGNNE